MGCRASKPSAADAAASPSAPAARGEASSGFCKRAGLSQYSEAFQSAGFDDFETLASLTCDDLRAIVSHTGRDILPGHRKKLLLTSAQLGHELGITAPRPVEDESDGRDNRAALSPTAEGRGGGEGGDGTLNDSAATAATISPGHAR